VHDFIFAISDAFLDLVSLLYNFLFIV